MFSFIRLMDLLFLLSIKLYTVEYCMAVCQTAFSSIHIMEGGGVGVGVGAGGGGGGVAGVISSAIVLRWVSLDFTDDKSTLVQIMAWCHQASSHYLSQYWPRSMSPYGVIRPQLFNVMFQHFVANSTPTIITTSMYDNIFEPLLFILSIQILKKKIHGDILVTKNVS